MNIRIKFPITAAILAASVLTLRAAGPAETLARVGDIEVTVADVKPKIDSLSAAEQEALAANPALLKQFVRSLIVQQMLLRKALTAKWDKQPEVVVQLERLRETAIAQGYLRSVSEPAKDYPSETEIEAAYNENKDALRVPKQYRLAQIFVAVPRDANKESSAAAKVKLEDIQDSLRKPGADFAVVARTRSEDGQSAARGGEVGWLAEAQIQPEIRGQLGNLAAGAVSQPVRLDDGYHILRVMEVKEAYTPELAEVRDALATRLRTAQTEANSEAYLTKLVEESPIAVNEIRLTELLPKATN